MNVENYPPPHIELLNPTQPAPAPGELETFPRITLSQEAIICLENLHKDMDASSSNQSNLLRRRRFQRNRQRQSRFRTQPITFAEITEVEEPPEETKVASTSTNRWWEKQKSSILSKFVLLYVMQNKH